MMKWVRRARAAFGMAVIWGLIWGIVGGFVMEAIVDPHGKIGDMWPPFFAMLGFVAGFLFSVILWVSEGRRRFDELSLPKLTGLGALGGLLMGGYAAADLNASVPTWVRIAVLLGPPTLCAASAASTLLLARKAEEKLGSGARSLAFEAGDDEPQKLPG